MMVSLRSPERAPLSCRLTQLLSVVLSAPVTRKFIAVGSASGNVSGGPWSAAGRVWPGAAVSATPFPLPLPLPLPAPRLFPVLMATLRPFSP